MTTGKLSIRGLFEAHLTVRDLARSIAFYRGVLGLDLAAEIPERRAAFFWVGGHGGSMLGLWETGSGPQRLGLHTAFRVDFKQILEAVRWLRAAGVTPLDFDENPADEPVVIGWMPALSVYFRDPDGNLLEFLAMLHESPRPEAGVLKWSEWRARGEERTATPSPKSR